MRLAAKPHGHDTGLRGAAEVRWALVVVGSAAGVVWSVWSVCGVVEQPHLWRRENPLCAGGGVRGLGVCGLDSILVHLHNTHTQSELHACMAPSP